MVKHVKTAEFEAEVLKSDKKVLVDFFATWCGPCSMLAPVLEQVSESNTDVKIVKVDVDAEPELMDKYDIMSVPTLLVFENGEVTKKSLGMISKSELLDLIR